VAARGVARRARGVVGACWSVPVVGVWWGAAVVGVSRGVVDVKLIVDGGGMEQKIVIVAGVGFDYYG